MTLYLHNAFSQAHLDDLRARLSIQLAPAVLGSPDAAGQARIDWLVEVVRLMDQGDLSPKDALAAFAAEPVPGFHFGRWLVEMVDEGVYLEDLYNAAA